MCRVRLEEESEDLKQGPEIEKAIFRQRQCLRKTRSAKFQHMGQAIHQSLNQPWTRDIDAYFCNVWEENPKLKGDYFDVENVCEIQISVPELIGIQLHLVLQVLSVVHPTRSVVG